MKVSRKRDPSACCYGQIETPDDYKDCAVCGNPVRWPWEPVAWDADGNICHAECVEKEEPR